jgi:nitrogen regulatory protein P-II 1
MKFAMKKVDAIIRPSQLDAVQQALERRGIDGLTLTEVAGSGHQPSIVASYRGAAFAIDSHARIRLEVVVPDFDAIPIADTIARAARTGRLGDGLVMIVPVAEAVRIRTGDRGVQAVATGPVDLNEDRRPATSRTAGSSAASLR